MIPEALNIILDQQIFSFSRIEELSEERFAVDRSTFEEVGTKAHISVPIIVGDEVLGVLTFGFLSHPGKWRENLFDRLRLVAHVFGSALVRRDGDRRLKSALAELEVARKRLTTEADYLKSEIASGNRYEEIVGDSTIIRMILNQVDQVAPTDATILVLGETGTGKELIARHVHRKSSRAHRPLIKVNCATLPDTLIESELFGHESGAFTGAVKRKIGRFEVANGGTIFLDEIGDLPPDLQVKLLRVLQDGEFERLGSNTTLEVDVRVIAATNRDLKKSVSEGSFRDDLYYRLRVVPIELPPLRERRGDIPQLVWHFVRRHQTAMNKSIRRIPNRLTKALIGYDWPGNVRELANVIERAVILTTGDTLVVDEAFVHNPAFVGVKVQAEDIREVERAHIVDVLEKCGWKVKGHGNAAERLGLNPSTLRARMKKLGIQRP